MKCGVISFLYFVLFTNEILLVCSTSMSELAAVVDVGDGKKRVHRGAAEEEEEAADVIEQNAQTVPELIPIAESRKARGNGADSSDIVADFVTKVTGETDADVKEMAQREEGISPADAADIDKKVDARSSQIIQKKCKEDTETCEENSNCCSGFCSWTKNFTCFTVL